MEKNKIIRSFWMGSPLSNLEKLSIHSFLQNGHRMEVFLYDLSIRLPDGVKKRDAREIIPFNKIFIDSRGSYASFSDWFRFKMLFDLGGWWSDLDSVCLRPFDTQDSYCFSSEGDEQNYKVNCGNIKAPKNATFLEECLYEINKLLSKRDNSWGNYGINLIQKVLKNYEFETYLYSPKYFCPIHYSQVSNIVSEKYFDLNVESYAVHLWNGMWKFRKLDKNGVYPQSSLFERLKKKYLPI